MGLCWLFILYARTCPSFRGSLNQKSIISMGQANESSSISLIGLRALLKVQARFFNSSMFATGSNRKRTPKAPPFHANVERNGAT